MPENAQRAQHESLHTVAMPWSETTAGTFKALDDQPEVVLGTVNVNEIWRVRKRDLFAALDRAARHRIHGATCEHTGNAPVGERASDVEVRGIADRERLRAQSAQARQCRARRRDRTARAPGAGPRSTRPPSVAVPVTAGSCPSANQRTLMVHHRLLPFSGASAVASPRPRDVKQRTSRHARLHA